MAASPTARSLEECRKRGWMASVVERWIPQAGKRLDAFGFGDILVVQPGLHGSLLIQATSRNNVSSRIRKIAEERQTEAATWLLAGNRIAVWGWGKTKPRGQQRALWSLREVDVALADLSLVVP